MSRSKVRSVREREQAIVTFLAKRGAAGPNEIWAALDPREAFPTVRTTLWRMVAQGILTQPERGFYDVSPAHRPDPSLPPASLPPQAQPLPPAFGPAPKDAAQLLLPAGDPSASLVKLTELIAAVRHIQGVEGFAAVDIELAAQHLERAADWMTGRAKPELAFSHATLEGP